MLTRVRRLTIPVTVVMRPTPIYDAAMNQMGYLQAYGFNPQTGNFVFQIRAFRTRKKVPVLEAQKTFIQKLTEKIGVSGALEEFRKLVEIPTPPPEFRTEVVAFETDNFIADVVVGYNGIRLSGIWDFDYGTLTPFYLTPLGEAKRLNEMLSVVAADAWALRTIARQTANYKHLFEEMKSRLLVTEQENRVLQKKNEALKMLIKKEAERSLEAEGLRIVADQKARIFERAVQEMGTLRETMVKLVEEETATLGGGIKAIVDQNREVMESFVDLRMTIQQVVGGVRLTDREILQLVKMIALEHPELLRRTLQRIRFRVGVEE